MYLGGQAPFTVTAVLKSVSFMQAWIDLYMFKVSMLSSVLNVPYLMDIVYGKNFSLIITLVFYVQSLNKRCEGFEVRISHQNGETLQPSYFT